MPLQLCPIVIGREAELEALRQAVSSAAAGRGRCVLLVGEAGIGKSRLAREAASEASAAGLTVISGRAVPGSASAVYRPLTEALLQILRDHPIPDDAEVAPWLAVLHPLLPVVGSGHIATADVSATVRGEAVLQLMKRLRPAGAAVVLEDLHWADPDTVAVVEYLADNVVRERLLLVATLRDSPPSAALEMARRRRAAEGIAHMQLERLSGDECAAMVRACRPEVADDDLARVSNTAEGVPLLVEDLLASPGVPDSFAATVRTRLANLDETEGEVILAAAILGRDFDWRLLPEITGQPGQGIDRALTAGVSAQLLSSQEGGFRFRHALTREVVLDQALPNRVREVALAALRTLVAARPVLEGSDRETAIDLAVRAGDDLSAGRWLLQSGRQAMAWGALASASDALRNARDLLLGCPEQAEAELSLVEALALAGRVEEAAAVGGRLVARLRADPAMTGLRAQAHLQLAQAAVAASRWQMARHHAEVARELAGPEPPLELAAQIGVLDAEIALDEDDYDAARSMAEHVGRMEGAAPEVRCHAFEIVGRTHRSIDLVEGRRAFEQALVVAETADLALWRLRALHELGTIDLFDHAGVDRLLRAREAAERSGALGTVAVLDLQLSAAFTCRWDLEACDAHARSAIDTAERLGLHQVKAKALAHLTGSAGMRADLAATERYAGLALSAAPEDQMLQGFCWAMRAMALLVAGDADASVEPYERGMRILGRLPHAEPAAVRALWPLLLASRGDRRTRSAIDEARRLGVGAFGMNRALIGYAEAVAAAGGGDLRRAHDTVTENDPGFSNCAGWADLARLLAAPSALAGGWADACGWLTGASLRFAERGLPALAARCAQLEAQTRSNPWSHEGISAREADVLRLIAEGLSNKDIAGRLHLSARTVEKHVESLLRKTSARSRTELAARVAGSAVGRVDRPSAT